MTKERFQRVLLDTGPLVAMLRPGDQAHTLCLETAQQIEPPLLTSWHVITEAAWLLRASPQALQNLYAGPAVGIYRLLNLADDDLPAIAALSVRYRTLQPQLADLSLVHLAQREGLETIFTLDEHDFTVFRRKGRAGFRHLPAARQ